MLSPSSRRMRESGKLRGTFQKRETYQLHWPTHGESKIETGDEVISEMCLGISYSLDPTVKALVPSLSLSIFYCHKGRLALGSLKARLENIRQIEHKREGLAYFIHNGTGIGVLRIPVSPDISFSDHENSPHLSGIVLSFGFFFFFCSCFVLLFYIYIYMYTYIHIMWIFF